MGFGYQQVGHISVRVTWACSKAGIPLRFPFFEWMCLKKGEVVLATLVAIQRWLLRKKNKTKLKPTNNNPEKPQNHNQAASSFVLIWVCPRWYIQPNITIILWSSLTSLTVWHLLLCWLLIVGCNSPCKSLKFTFYAVTDETFAIMRIYRYVVFSTEIYGVLKCDI